jgi:hypothetical protein
MNGRLQKPDNVTAMAAPIYCAAMRSWVLSVLLAVMSLQSVWASVAPYCQHQADAVTDHIGHHEHKHVAAATTDGGNPAEDELASSEANPGTLDNDCGYCHLSHAEPLAIAAEPWLGQAEQELAATVPFTYSTRELEGLERPNWQRLARSASLEELPIT